MNFLFVSSFVIFLLFYLPGFDVFSQRMETVQWQVISVPVSSQEIILQATARVGPGWHLYSQFLEEGGPQPTRFLFESGQGIVFVGTPEEQGTSLTFHDEVYGMDITWFSGEVQFLQHVGLQGPVTTIRGRVEYMTCNHQVCVPGRHDFMVDLSNTNETP